MKREASLQILQKDHNEILWTTLGQYIYETEPETDKILKMNKLPMPTAIQERTDNLNRHKLYIY